MKELCFQDGQKVLCIGDSITDCGRFDPQTPLGNGYVSMLRDLIIGGWPERNLTWVNKGTSGHRVTDLQARWEDDVLREAPDWLSIKIGINDLHRTLFVPEDAVPPELFHKTYDDILTQATTKIHPQIILVTPFYISTDRTGNTDESRMLSGLAEYIATVEEMAKKYNTRLVRLQPMFEKQLKYRPAATFCPEPVHPNLTGHMLIAQEILRVLCG